MTRGAVTGPTGRAKRLCITVTAVPAGERDIVMGQCLAHAGNGMASPRRKSPASTVTTLDKTTNVHAKRDFGAKIASANQLAPWARRTY